MRPALFRLREMDRPLIAPAMFSTYSKQVPTSSTIREGRAPLPAGGGDPTKGLEARFGDHVVSEIKTEEIREWLTGLPLATKSRNRTSGIRRAGLQSRRRLRLPPGESGYQDQEIQRTLHRRGRNLDSLGRRNRATISRRRPSGYSVSDALLLLRSPDRDSRTAFVVRCKVRRTAG